jgi:hypothetical protein
LSDLGELLDTKHKFGIIGELEGSQALMPTFTYRFYNQYMRRLLYRMCTKRPAATLASTA